jgi:hypothetical protein
MAGLVPANSSPITRPCNRSFFASMAAKHSFFHEIRMQIGKIKEIVARLAQGLANCSAKRNADLA